MISINQQKYAVSAESDAHTMLQRVKCYCTHLQDWQVQLAERLAPNLSTGPEILLHELSL